MAKRRVRKQGPGWRPWLIRFLLLASALGLLALVILDYQVRSKFDGKKWALPAQVYARPLELYAGMALEPVQLEARLKALGYVPVLRLSGPGQFARSHQGSATHYQLANRGFDFWDQPEPAGRWQLVLAQGQILSLQSADGDQSLRLEPEKIGGIYPDHREDRVLVRLADIPPLLGETLLAVEDKQFLEHQGLSLRGIARALMANLQAGGVAQGGSTLTQQLVKNFYLTNERSLSRKATEAIMALLLELHYSKAEILETYLNEVYLGQQGAKSIHGFGLAAQHYFRRPLAELSADQIALLVGLVKGASYYNPWRHPERALARRDLVLQIMADTGLIGAAEHRRVSALPLRLAPQATDSITRYANFLDLVKRQLRRDYRAEDLQSEGLHIYTSLDTAAQALAEQQLADHLGQVEQQHRLERGGLQGALVLLQVGSAEVLALAGDRTPSLAGFNRALDARRQIGSLAKPAIYLAALQQPARYQLNTLVSDAPVTVQGPDGQWAPQNYDRQSHGEVPLFQALAQSYNQAAARLGMQLGLGQVAQTLERLGGEGEVTPVPAMLLGALARSPLDMASQYHTLAADGFYSAPRAILGVSDARGRPLSRYPLKVEQRFPAEAVYQLQYGLRAVLREGTGRAAYQWLPASLDLAGKTGTTNDQRDSWFAGFSADHLAVVWVGRDDNGTTPLTGATGALPVWAGLMAGLHTRGLDAPAPKGIALHWVDSATGQGSGENCEGARIMPFSHGASPTGRVTCRHIEHPVLHWWKKLWQ